MRIIGAGEGLECLNFPEKDGFDYGFNIYHLRSAEGSLIIDTAFRSQIRKVLGHAQVTHAVLTHFHNDHVAGLLHLPSNTAVMGSPRYGETLSKDVPQTVRPVSFEEPFRFGGFTLNFIPAPGHSPCSMFIDINGDFLHAGDNLMSRYDGRRIVPWVTRAAVPRHIESLEKLRGMNRDRVILSHGPMIQGVETVKREIDMRLHYLRRVLENRRGLTIEEALPDSPADWVSHGHFHQLMEESSDRK